MKYIFRYFFSEKNTDTRKSHLDVDLTSKFVIRHNVRGRSLNEFIRAYNENEQYRLVKRCDSRVIDHTIISFAPESKKYLNEKILRDISSQFIKLRGEENLYVATLHNESHLHLHFAVSGTDISGRSSRMSKAEFRSLKISLQEYQKENYPALVDSIVQHGNVKELRKDNLIKKIKVERQSIKDTLVKNLEQAYTTAKTKDDFVSIITKLGYEPYYRAGELKGVRFQGKTKFRFSSLGMNTEQLDELDKSSLAEQTLAILQNIRQGKNRELEKIGQVISDKVVPLFSQDKEEQNLLNQLSAMRSKSIVHAKEQTEQMEKEKSYEDEKYESPLTDASESGNGILSEIGKILNLTNPLNPLAPKSW